MLDLQNIIKIADNNGKPCIIATVTDSCGSAPQQPGARMLVYADGRTVGSIGGGCVEGNAIKKSLSMLVSNNENAENFFTLRVELNDPLDQKDGDICGGTMDILLEKLNPQILK